MADELPFCIVRTDARHETIVFPYDDVEFCVPFGYGKDHMRSYQLMIQEVRDRCLW